MELTGVAIGYSERSEQRRQFSVGMQITGSEGHGAFAVTDEPADSGSDGCQPIGDVLRVADRSGEQKESSLPGTKDDGFFPHHYSLRIGKVLRFVQNHQPQRIQSD